MLDAINSFLMSLADPLLGWLLHLPRDLALVIIAVGTALLLTVIRKWSTNQDMLKRCTDDKAVLKKRVAAAKKQNDKETVTRCGLTVGQIGMKTMMAEGKPLLWSLIPIGLIAAWAFGRMGYLPAQSNETVNLKMYFPEVSEELVHLVPQDGVSAANGWIHHVAEDKASDGSSTGAGVAEWRVRFQTRPQPYILKFRCKGRTLEKEFLADGLRYSTPVSSYGENSGELFQIELPIYKPLGIVPGLSAVMLEPWMIAYLAIAISLSFALKPLLRIY